MLDFELGELVLADEFENLLQLVEVHSVCVCQSSSSSVVTRVSSSTPSLGDQHIVFDSDAAPAREVRARLDREHHAGRNLLVARVHIRTPLHDPGILVHFDPQTVARAVPERLAPYLRPRGRSRAAASIAKRDCPGPTAAIAASWALSTAA